jgi:hypothetical protein
MESKITGEVVVDVKNNVVKQKSMTIEGTGNMDMMGQAVPITVKVEATSTTKSL